MSRNMDRLESRWERGQWPKWLEWIEIDGIRGWEGQRIKFEFPITALVGENGVGKSTVLQAAASVYNAPGDEDPYYASDFFPSTPWEDLAGVEIRYSARQGDQRVDDSVRRPTQRWRGNQNRPDRNVRYVDLRRSQPIMARRGYRGMTRGNVDERTRRPFDGDQLDRFADILGRQYDSAVFALSTASDQRWVPVASLSGNEYSGFHQGAGETTIADLLREEIPDYGLVLIDEIETSLHPRAQRRLVRDLAERARLQQLQIVLTTHSPYVLEELPPRARSQIVVSEGSRDVMTGVSPEFAMSRMDEQPHPEADIYVEDDVAQYLVRETLAEEIPDRVPTVRITPYGSAQVGKALGQMVEADRFPRPTVVFLDGDQDPADGCHVLPGDEAPERVVFADLRGIGWMGIAQRLNRSHAELADAADRAMAGQDHHDWLREVGDAIFAGGHEVWKAMVVTWLDDRARDQQKQAIVDPVEEALGR